MGGNLNFFHDSLHITFMYTFQQVAIGLSDNREKGFSLQKALFEYKIM